MLRLCPGDLLLLDGLYVRIQADVGDSMRELPSDRPQITYDAIDESRGLAVKLVVRRDQVTVIRPPANEDIPQSMPVPLELIEIYPCRLLSE